MGHSYRHNKTLTERQIDDDVLILELVLNIARLRGGKVRVWQAPSGGIDRLGAGARILDLGGHIGVVA